MIQNQKVWTLGIQTLKTLLFSKHHCLMDPLQLSLFTYNFALSLSEERY